MMTQPSTGKILRTNQIPIALIGVGIAWLLTNNTGLTGRVVRDVRVLAARRRIGELGIGRIAERGGQSPGSDGKGADGWVHQAAEAARGAIGSVRDTGNAALDRATSGITSYAGDAGDLAKRAGGQLVEKLERDPWLIGVVGFVAGALLAALLPPTRAERELLGEARDELRGKAIELGREAAERVRELADSTTRTSRH
jgi:hypothetical protein